MLESLSGRINRKTFIFGNLVAAGVLLFFVLIIVLPLAILDLAINNKTFDEIVGVLYLAVIFPLLLYYFYFVVLMVKRVHDIGLPGLLLVIAFTAALLLGRINSLWFLNLISIGLFLFLCIKPGASERNNFGPVPRRPFRLNHLKVHF